MSKLLRLRAELNTLEREGKIEIEGEEMTIVSDNDEVVNRILETGPWGALLLMGKLDEAVEKLKNESVTP